MTLAQFVHRIAQDYPEALGMHINEATLIVCNGNTVESFHRERDAHECNGVVHCTQPHATEQDAAEDYAVRAGIFHKVTRV